MSEDIGYNVKVIDSVPRALTSDSVDAMYLANFLSRPVNIYSYTWAETDVPTTYVTFAPWSLFFSDTRIKAKLDRFAFLQCTLKVKVVINASPFYYGAVLINYVPMAQLSNPVLPSLTSPDAIFTLTSQRPHLWLYPQNNSGGEMILPYINNRNWTRTIVANDFLELGQLTSMVAVQLASANGAVGTGVTITYFAWAEDVNVSGPTLGGVMAQGGDEYGSISTPTSVIAGIASALAPIIGPFALATQIGATALSKIAHMFGYTNVPNIKDVDPVNIKPFHNFADTSISFPIDKLTMDPKNELTISQLVAGVPDEIDPLNIESLCNRESVLAIVPWDTTDAADTALFYTNINPGFCNIDVNSVNDTSVASTPMAYVAAMFRQWRGDVVIRIHVIASRFHKGRFRLIYDPFGDSTTNIVSTVNSYSGCINTVIDLSEETNIEFVIPYSQATAFQYTQEFGRKQHQISHSPIFNRDYSKDNGAFLIRSVTRLTAPVASSTINFIISVSGRNMEFANPSAQVCAERRYSFKPAQGGFEYDSMAITHQTASTGKDDPNMYKVYFGERIVSIRQLIKRMNYLTSVNSGLVTGVGCYQTTVMGRIPPTFGYDINGGQSAAGLVTPGSNFNFEYSLMSPLTWFIPCFVGQRGSINYAFSTGTTDGHERAEIFVMRRPIYSVPHNSNAQYTFVTSTGSKFIEYNSRHYVESSAGCSITCGYTNHGFEFQMPMYSHYKFQSTKIDQGLERLASDDSSHDTFSVIIKSLGSVNQSQYNIYCGAGTDFNLIFFLNCPVVHIYNVTPTAN